MLSKYLIDNFGPVCRIEDCSGCVRDCRAVYVKACADYEQEGWLTEQELRHLRSISQAKGIHKGKDCITLEPERIGEILPEVMRDIVKRIEKNQKQEKAETYRTNVISAVKAFTLSKKSRRSKVAIG